MTLQQSHREPPVEKSLTSVKSLNPDVRGAAVPRKTQVKMISSCPLPQPSTDPGPGPGSGPQAFSQVPSYSASEVGGRRECPVPLEPEYSLPFDTVTADTPKAGQAPGPGESGSDPLYDSIDEMLIRNIFLSDGGGSTRRKVEHIYDEPEGCAAPCLQEEHASVYDDPEEMRGDAWRVLGMADHPKGHDPPSNPEDDYAVPKRRHRNAAAPHSTTEEDSVEEAEKSPKAPYSNMMATAK